MKRLLIALCILAVTACNDAPATQYVGSVRSQAFPESEGSLRLTLFSRDDSSFSGLIELGEPARGTGSAYAWHDDAELRVVTVGADSGDTILWVSPLTDEGLGGRFEVIGGDREGDEGTWRASLVQGNPATPETLLLPPPAPMPPITALWPLVLLAAACIWLAKWIRRAPVAVAQDQLTPAAAHSSAPAVEVVHRTGIGGWLLFFTIGQAINLLVSLVGLGTAMQELADSIAVGTVLIGMQPLVVLETGMHALAIPVALGGLVLLIRRSAHAPRFWFAYLAASCVYLAVDLLALTFIESQMLRLLGEEIAQEGTDGTRVALVMQLIASALWATYWVRSRRVRTTFGAAALDRTATVLVDAAAKPAAPVEARRPPSRAALVSAGALVSVLLALYVIGRLLPPVALYSLPPDVDIRETVAGRWTWTSDSAGCRNAHTIAFAQGGEIMTITSQDISSVDPVTTYDIEFVSQSIIRGAIRGETRVTDANEPVVWDLVLTGPDEYRWQRTDHPGSYTASNRRCPQLVNGSESVDEAPK